MCIYTICKLVKLHNIFVNIPLLHLKQVFNVQACTFLYSVHQNKYVNIRCVVYCIIAYTMYVNS